MFMAVMSDHHSFISADEYWLRHVGHQRASGTSVRKYCERHGLSQSSFYLWRKKLSLAVPNGFAELLPVATMSAPAQPAGVIELHHSCGWRVVVGENFDEAHLTRVLAAVSRSC